MAIGFMRGRRALWVAGMAMLVCGQSSPSYLLAAEPGPTSSWTVQIDQDPVAWCRQARQAGGSLREADKAALLRQIIGGSGRADRAWLSKFAPSQLSVLQDALVALEARVEVRRSLMGDWCDVTHEQWSRYTPREMTLLIEVLGKQLPDSVVGGYIERATELSWSLYLDQLADPAKLPSRPDVLQLASVVVPRARLAKRNETLELFRKGWVGDEKMLASLEASEVLGLSTLIERLTSGKDPYGDEAARVLLRWVEAGGDQYIRPASLLGMLQALRRQGARGDQNHQVFGAAADRVIKDAAARHLDDAAWVSTAGPDELCELVTLTVAAMDADTRQALTPKIMGILRDVPGREGEPEKSVAPLAIKAAVALDVDRVTISRVLDEQIARRMQAMDRALLGDPVTGPRAWERLLADIKSYRVMGKRGGSEPPKTTEDRVYEAAMSRLEQPAYFMAYDPRALLFMAERACELVPGTRDERMSRLIGAWVSNKQFVADLSDSRVRPLIVALLRIAGGRVQAQELVAAWVRNSEHWKLHLPSRWAELYAFVDRETPEGGEARRRIGDQMYAAAVDKAFLQRCDPNEVQRLMASVIADRGGEVRHELTGHVLERLVHEEMSLVPTSRMNLWPWRVALEILSASPPPAKDQQAWLTWAEGWMKESLSREPASVGMVSAILGNYGREVWSPLVEQQVSDSKITGDAAASWRLAHAYVIETLPGGVSGIFSGARQINEAISQAESEPTRLAALRWLVARNLEAQYYQEAENLILGMKGQFASKEAQAEMESMLGRVKTVGHDDAQRQTRSSRYTDLSRTMGRLSVLKARLDQAKADGRPASELVRLETMVANVDAELTRLRME